jgi:ribosomal protein L37AE/L43A
MSGEMLEALHPYLDAANLDLKAFSNETYRRYVGAPLQPVLDSLKVIRDYGIWLEVTTLVIPGLNDDPAELRDAARFIAAELGTRVPWHISRFYPAHNMTDRPPTPFKMLQRAKEIGAEEGLKYIYIGNVPSAVNEDTVCPDCGRTLIARSGFSVIANQVRAGHCPYCGREHDGRIRRGIGMAVVMHGSGIAGLDMAAATLKMNDDGSFSLLIGATDLGTGSDTILAQIAAEVLHIPADDLIVYSSDTDFTPFDKGAYASSTTYISGGQCVRPPYISGSRFWNTPQPCWAATTRRLCFWKRAG